jgi:hypothetical protein
LKYSAQFRQRGRCLARICSAHALISWLLGYDALSLLFADWCDVVERQSVLASVKGMSCGC